MTKFAPAQTLDQRMSALARANEIRVIRAELKKNLKRRTAQALPILLAPAPELASMHILPFLKAIPFWGAARGKRAMLKCRVAESRTLGGLSERQREDLVAYLRKAGVS